MWSPTHVQVLGLILKFIKDIYHLSCSEASQGSEDQREEWHQWSLRYNWSGQGEVPDLGGGEDDRLGGVDGAMWTVGQKTKKYFLCIILNFFLRLIPSKGNTAEIVLTVLHRNFLGVDEFLGRVPLPLTNFDHNDKPKSRWRYSSWCFISWCHVSGGIHCSASQARVRQTTEESWRWGWSSQWRRVSMLEDLSLIWGTRRKVHSPMLSEDLSWTLDQNKWESRSSLIQAKIKLPKNDFIYEIF